MSNLQIWEEKIKAKRKQTEFRDFVKEIASWFPLGLQKNGWRISRYPEKRIYKLVSNKEFSENRDSLTSTGMEYDFSQTFGANFGGLLQQVPLSPTIQQWNNENADFADSVLNSRDVYLSFWVFESCKGVFYSSLVVNNCTNIYNSLQITNNCENVHCGIGIDGSSFVFYSKYILNSHHIYFSTNLTGCTECIWCDSLENKSYCIGNEQLSKEAYAEKKKAILNDKLSFARYYSALSNKSKTPNSVNSTGNSILFSNNIENGYYVTRANTGRNLVLVTWDEKDSNLYDCCDAGLNAVDFYGVQWWGTNANNYYCVSQCESCFNVYYSFYLYNCSFCLGCVWLKNKSYCILNKQYTKEEWYSLADRIFAQMDADGILGDFFPGSMNPFYFNDTMAYLIDDTFTKEEVEKEWYLWRDEAIKVDIPEGADIIETTDLGEYQGFYESKKEDPETSSGWQEWCIDSEILKKVIRDEKGNFYKIVPMELEFLRKHSLPLPEIHWLERIKMGFRM